MRVAGILVFVAACGGSSGAPDAMGGGDDDDAAIDAPAAVIEPYHIYGRWDAQSRAGWPGAALVGRFRGTELAAMFSESGDDWLEVTIDGTAQPAVHLLGGAHTAILATGLSDGEHDFEVVKRTESFVGILQFAGFVGTTMFVPTARAARTIEFIGDSITAGYGVLGAQPCDFTHDTEAESHAWGALAAHDLGAAHFAIAYSGIGMYRSCCNGTGSTTDVMPAMYGRVFADQPASAWDFHVVPDVVVIALGTNDFSGGSDPGAPFVTAYESFIADQVRAHAPHAPILLATSPMLSGASRATLRADLDAVVAHFADPTIAVVDIPEQLAADGYGCDYHPNEVTARKMANAVVPAIRAAAGW